MEVTQRVTVAWFETMEVHDSVVWTVQCYVAKLGNIAPPSDPYFLRRASPRMGCDESGHNCHWVVGEGKKQRLCQPSVVRTPIDLHER